jgi:hypothetical protein
MECLAQHRNLFWYAPEDKNEQIVSEFLVEPILNYGDKDAVIQLIQICR